ncbi:hypothetical protein ACHAWF_004684 [Thalassiosira exigua]
MAIAHNSPAIAPSVRLPPDHQRRLDEAMGDLDNIETSLPAAASAPRSRRGDRDRSSYGGTSCAASASRSSAGRAVVRTSRRLVADSRQATYMVLVEGRTKVARCEDGRGRTILHPTRVTIPPGSVTAILGASESGKSTLLKLAGCMDRKLVYDGAVNLPGTKSFLPEETYLQRFYTPQTYIKHYNHVISSKIGLGCCGPNQSQFQDERYVSSTVNGANGELPIGKGTLMTPSDVESLLDSLRIDLDRRNTIVGDIFRKGLNHGEQRRLELGLMALSSPDTLFCENPVAGLDSETSLHVMEFLKGYISNSNRRVILTLNKPSLFVWNLIDNIVLLSKGRVVYEGPRSNMESFFAFHKLPTPKRFSPLEHYLAVVNNFRRPDNAVNWENAFKEWQEAAEEDDGDSLDGDIETCFPTAIPDVIIPRIQRDEDAPSRIVGILCCGGWCRKFLALTHRYLLNMLHNPGMLLVRLLMYTGLSLLLGLLFYNLSREDSYQSANSRAALLFYSSSFFIFMVVAVLPFLSHDLYIRDKEILNGFYHPVTHHLAVTVASVPAVFILALVITAILVGMVKLRNATYFYSILAMALWCAESYALLMASCVRNNIISIVVLAGIFGMSMPLCGFMLVPSSFPSWLRWSYHVPFHTYAWRSFMYNEFINAPSGKGILETYEIEDTNVRHDLVVLFSYGLVS